MPKVVKSLLKVCGLIDFGEVENSDLGDFRSEFSN